MKKPNLFVVGAQKTGTTSLYNYLYQHPDVFTSHVKEPNYFCKDLHNDSDQHVGREFTYQYRTENQYLDLFKKAKNEKIVGDFSTHNLYSNVAARNIYEFNYQAKIVIMLRNPAEFIDSLHKQQLFEANEDEEQLEKALDLESKRKKSIKYLPKSSFTPSRLYYKEQAKFYEQVKRYYDIFPEKNIKVILLKDLKEQPKNTIKDLCDFLNIYYEKDIYLGKNNTRRSVKNKKIQQIIKSPNNKLKIIIKKITPKFMQQIILRTIIQMNRKPEKRVLKEETKKELLIELRGNIKKLSKLIKRDLETEWNLKQK